MGLNMERVAVLLLLAGLVSMLARKIRLPYTVGLVLAGGALAWLPLRLELSLTKDLIFSLLLPPLIFEAAFHLEWKAFRRELGVLILMATLGVLLSVLVAASGIRLLLHWEWGVALVIGVLLSATDPVSVIATFKEVGLKGRLRLLLEAESLLNDGTVAVLFSVAMALLVGNSASAGAMVASFVFTIVGGIVCGGLVAGLVLGLAGKTDDHLVEITFTTIAAYGSFFVAEYFHVSGVLAVLSAGLLVGNRGSLGAISDKGREATVAFWEYAGFVANSLIFLLIGVRLTKSVILSSWQSALLLLLLVTLGRALAVYLCSAMVRHSEQKVPKSHQHVLFWGGLRGALALALAMGLPDTLTNRESLLNTLFLAVAGSVVLQGVTIAPLLRRLKLLTHHPE
jgi:CPA1 family monovalent cation:H+ antiporter